MAIKAASESGLLKAVKQLIALRGGFAIRVNSGAFAGTYGGKKRFVRLNSEPGCSDLLVCYRGRFLALETKLRGRKPTAAQRSFLLAIEAAGGWAAVVNDLDDVRTLLDAIDAEEPYGTPKKMSSV
jgi:hypothetical protein